MKNALSLITLACLVSCQTNGGDSAADESTPPGKAPAAPSAEPAPAAETPAINFSDTDSLIGQPLEKVKAACDAAGLRCRVVEIDGESLPVTMDYLPERLNFSIKSGRITGVSKG
jgi:hypothetical protein